MPEQPVTFGSLLLAALIGGGFGTALVTFILDRFKARAEASDAWRTAALVELFGPLVLNFDRTKRAIGRYQGADKYLETQVLKASNQAIRDLLLAKGHFLEPGLLEAAAALIEHYDVWLAEYDRQRGELAPEQAARFVFAGPQGFQFPKDAEADFRKHYQQLQAQVSGRPIPRSAAAA